MVVMKIMVVCKMISFVTIHTSLSSYSRSLKFKTYSLSCCNDEGKREECFSQLALPFVILYFARKNLHRQIKFFTRILTHELPFKPNVSHN